MSKAVLSAVVTTGVDNVAPHQTSSFLLPFSLALSYAFFWLLMVRRPLSAMCCNLQAPLGVGKSPFGGSEGPPLHPQTKAELILQEAKRQTNPFSSHFLQSALCIWLAHLSCSCGS